MDFDRQVIVLVLAGEATELEAATLASWRSAALENDEAFLRQERMWLLLGRVGTGAGEGGQWGGEENPGIEKGLSPGDSSGASAGSAYRG
jgi:hypothetical protein